MFWSFAATGLAYAALGAWRLSLGRGGNSPLALVIAFFAMSFWAFSGLTGSPALAAAGQLARSIAWILYFGRAAHVLPERWSGWARMERGLMLLAVLAATATWLGLANVGPLAPALWLLLALACHLLFAIGAIVYLHNLHSGLGEDTGTGFRLIVVSLGVLWAYDLNLYTVGLLGYGLTAPLAAGRPLVALLLVPVLAVAARRREHWKLALSRKVTFQSLSMIAIGLYFVSMSLSSRAILLLDGSTGQVFVVLAAIALSAIAAALILLPDTRSRIKVLVTKHLFSHRYDYRTEWLRFSATIADREASELTLEERVVKAIAEVTESPAGLLMLTGDGDEPMIAAAWNWRSEGSIEDEASPLPEAIVRMLAQGRIAAFERDAAWPDRAVTDGATRAWIAVR